MHPFLKEYLGYCFYKAAFQVRARVDLELEPFGVVAPQFGILTFINTRGPLTQGELGLQMAIDKATMVRMVDGLEAKGYLKRVPSPTDRRANHLQVTASGKVATRAMDKARQVAEGEFLKPLTKVERQTLKALVIKLVR